MNLRKQFFTAFCAVAIVPLAVVTLYMFVSNLMLAFNLYEQNLQNSTEIQSNLIEENINQLMTRATKFTNLSTVQNACKVSNDSLMESLDLSKDILNFTDETLNIISIFSLTDQNGKVLYYSGSNTDKIALETVIDSIGMKHEQSVREISFGESGDALLIDTPVKKDSTILGHLFVVCPTDYFLRIISNHEQVESSNAFIYCTNCKAIVTSKLPLEHSSLKLSHDKLANPKGSFITPVGNQQVLAYYQLIDKTPWLLVSTISTSHIFSRIWSYGLINSITLLLAILVIFLLSHRQSRRMLHPLEQLLNAVEQFFISDTKQFPSTDIDPHTEIGYLAGKFSGMSSDMSAAQGKLKESNYLYASLMRATYEFRIVIDLQMNTIECSDSELAEQLQHMEEDSVSERILHLWQTYAMDDESGKELLSDIAYGHLQEPVETEINYHLNGQREELWYRIIVVPITNTDGTVRRMVIHFEDITRRKHREFGLIHSSQVDPLCGLFNKTAFPLYCMLSASGKSDVLFFIDLDMFKQVNDLLGHAAGDEVLVAAATAIRNQFRDTDTIGRFGGDEFVVFAPNMTRAQAERKADSLVHALSFQRYSPQGINIHVTASVGICIVEAPMTLEQALQIADQAMYFSKEHGRAQYHIASQNNLNSRRQKQ